VTRLGLTTAETDTPLGRLCYLILFMHTLQLFKSNKAKTRNFDKLWQSGKPRMAKIRRLRFGPRKSTKAKSYGIILSNI
jgi:hypothetical protein